MIRNYLPKDEPRLFSLWNTAGVKLGYAGLTAESFRALLTGHPNFSPEYTFVLEQGGEVQGFANGCTGGDIPKGDVRGYVTCLILAEAADTDENTCALLSALEAAFRGAGRTYSAVTFFNPIRLPWVIPGTDNHQHNNAPGVALDIPLHRRMLSMGYRETARECAMYRSLKDYQTPEWVEAKAVKMAREDYHVERYNPARHEGLEKMVDALQNSMWSAEIPAAGKAGMELLVGLKGRTCAGFTGPIYLEPTGRGYFAGLGVAPRYEGHGLGTLLFYRLLEREKLAGARYMSLFTGEDNPARFIYLGAGFCVVRTFGVMLKEL